MSKCKNCGKEINEFSITTRWTCIGGDPLCNVVCEAEYARQRDYFCSEVLPDDDKYDRWVKGEEFPAPEKDKS